MATGIVTLSQGPAPTQKKLILVKFIDFLKNSACDRELRPLPTHTHSIIVYKNFNCVDRLMNQRRKWKKPKITCLFLYFWAALYSKIKLSLRCGGVFTYFSSTHKLRLFTYLLTDWKHFYFYIIELCLTSWDGVQINFLVRSAA
jgi:hypothetical protein